MIIKGGVAGNIGFWTRHLMRDDTNEAVRLVELSGVMATTLNAALREMQAIARQSRCRGNFLYQANINPRADERLTPVQMMQSVERLERNLKLTGHQRVIIEHVKHGRMHWHVLWNRVDVETLKVTDITGNYATHVRTARELEQAFGLQPTPASDGTRPRVDKLWERRVEEETGITRAKVSADMTRAWHATTTGQQFRAAIGQLGYRLARGDRRDYCVVDPSGRAHSLARRLTGLDVGAVRQRMADIDPASLPSVAEARAAQKAALPDWKATRRTQAARQRLGLVAAKREIVRRRRRRLSPSAWSSAKPSAVAVFRAARRLTVPCISLAGTHHQIFHRVSTPSGKQSDESATASASPLPPVWSAPLIADVAGPVRPARQPGAMQFDATAISRAGAASAEESAKWQARIAATLADASLSPEQRAAAVASLRQQQQLAVKAVRRRIINEEKQRVRAAKRAVLAGMQELPKP